MLRKTLLNIISIFYMILGLVNCFNSLFPNWPSDPLAIYLFPLLGSALTFYAGLTMLRLSDIGRKLIIALLSLRVAINTLVILWLLFDNKDVWFDLYYFGEQLYRIENRYTYLGLLLVGVVVALLTIMFLSQKETRKFFDQETIAVSDSGKVISDGVEVESDVLI